LKFLRSARRRQLAVPRVHRSTLAVLCLTPDQVCNSLPDDFRDRAHQGCFTLWRSTNRQSAFTIDYYKVSGIYPAIRWMSWSHSSTLALKFTVLVVVAQNQKCVVGLAEGVLTSRIEESGVPVSLYPPKSNYIIPISNQSYYTAVRHGPQREPYRTRWMPLTISACAVSFASHTRTT